MRVALKISHFCDHLDPTMHYTFPTRNTLWEKTEAIRNLKKWDDILFII